MFILPIYGKFTSMIFTGSDNVDLWGRVCLKEIQNATSEGKDFNS